MLVSLKCKTTKTSFSMGEKMYKKAILVFMPPYIRSILNFCTKKKKSVGQICKPCPGVIIILKSMRSTVPIPPSPVCSLRTPLMHRDHTNPGCYLHTHPKAGQQLLKRGSHKVLGLLPLDTASKSGLSLNTSIKSYL